MKLKFSVIIPVYNREQAIRRCIDSVLSQSYRNYELLIIDDGSMDSTWSVLSEYSAMDRRIKLFRKSNGGVSSARNMGVAHATGEYLVFVDSDDWISQGYLAYLDTVLTSPDIDGIILDYYIDSSGAGRCDKAYSTASLPRELGVYDYRNMFFRGAIKNCMWDKVIRREVFIKGNVSFPEGISICEDAVVSASIGSSINRLIVTDKAFLHYVENSGSLSRSITTISTVNEVFAALIIMENVLDPSSSDVSSINELKLRQLFYYVMTLGICSKYEKRCVFEKFYAIIDDLRFKDCHSRRSKLYLLIGLLTKVPLLDRVLFYGYRFMKNRASS